MAPSVLSTPVFRGAEAGEAPLNKDQTVPHRNIRLLLEVQINAWDSGLSKTPCGEGGLDLRRGDRSQQAGRWTARGGTLTWLRKKTDMCQPSRNPLPAGVPLQAPVLISNSPSPDLRLGTAQFLEFRTRLGG